VAGMGAGLSTSCSKRATLPTSGLTPIVNGG